MNLQLYLLPPTVTVTVHVPQQRIHWSLTAFSRGPNGAAFDRYGSKL
jgi:hypothetical protein